MKAASLYLDDNADAPVLPAALAAYQIASQAFANPSSAHAMGQQAKALLVEARRSIASALGADPEELVLTSGGTEADALALLGALKGRTKPHVVSSAIEHPAVARNLEALAESGRAFLTRVASPRSGCLKVDDVLAAITPDTALVSIVLACNETGVVQPVREIAAACRLRGVLMHTDAVQAVGRMAVDVRSLGVDLLSFSGHKLGAVPGIGVLYVRSGTALAPLLSGGGQEGGRRAGTENIAGAASLAAALTHGPSDHERARLASLRNRLERGIATACAPVEIWGADSVRLPNTTSLRIHGCPGDGLMMALDVAGIAISTGSACSTGALTPSAILLGMGVTPSEAKETVRFSLPRTITEAGVDRVIATVAEVVARSRAAAYEP